MSNNEEKEHKLLSNKLPIGVLLFAVIIILGLISFKSPEKEYEITEAEMLEELLSYKQIVNPEMITEILKKEDPKYQLIDLRSPYEFIKGHLPNAINIPIHKIFDKEYEKIFNQELRTNVLYYSDHCGACGPWMLLSQLGYKNNKVLLGGYDYVNEYIIKTFAPDSGNYKNEKASFDYAKVISETSGAASKLDSSNNEPIKLPKKRKKKEENDSGGC